MSRCFMDPRLAARLVGDPVDVVTGAVFDVTREIYLPGPLPLDFRRHYSSACLGTRFPLGWGQTHSYDHTLRLDADGIRYQGPMEPPAGFPPLVVEGACASKDGWRLIRGRGKLFRLESHGRPSLEFELRDPARPAPVARIRQERALLSFTYDEEGRLAGLIDSAGRRLRVACDEWRRIAGVYLQPADSGRERMLLELGYDEAGNLAEGVDAYRHRFTFAYDEQRRLVGKTDRGGYTFRFEYDGRGRCVHAGGEDGIDEIWLRYESDEVTVVRRADGGEWIYIHPGGALAKIIDPYGGIREFVRDDAGRLSAEVDPNGNETLYVYEGGGALSGKLTPVGDFVPAGAEETDPRVHLVAACAAEYEHGRFLSHREITPPEEDSPLLASLPAEVAAAVTTVPEGGPRQPPGPVYDDAGKLIGEIDAFGRRTSYLYESSGAVRQMIDRDGGKHVFEHASWAQRVGEIDPTGQRMVFRNTFSGLLAEVADRGGAVSRYEYDLKDRLVAVHRHGVCKETYLRDAADNLVEKRDGEGNLLLSIEVGPGNRIASRTLASGETQAYEYDDRGRVVRMAGECGEASFAYDDLGHRILDERDGRGIRHRYAWRDQLAESTVLGRFRVKYARRDDRLEIQDPAGGRHTVRLLGHGLVEHIFSNGSTEMAQYDPEGRCLLKATRRKRSSGLRWVRAYRYSGEGDLLAVKDSVRGAAAYEYDAAHRLVSALRGSVRLAYDYAPGDNLLRQPGLEGVLLLPGNRLVKANGDAYKFDLRNNVSERQGKRPCIFRHDSRDQLTGCTLGEGREWTARYDPLGRRTEKIFQGQRTEYLWDTDRLAAEIDPEGRFRLFIYEDAFALVPFLFIDYPSVEADPASGQRRFLFTDQIGTPLLAEDDEGEAVWSATIEPYGMAQVDSASVTDLALRFPGHYADEETGLHYNRFRYYSPEIGRYLESDPLGVSGGANLYAYPASPLSHVDVRGLTCDACEAAGKRAAEEDKGDEEANGQPRRPTPEELDQKYGPATEPWLRRPGEGEFPLDAQIVRPGEPINLTPYTNPDGTPGRYVFIVTENGNMIIAPENGASSRADGSPRATKHTDLAQNGAARVSGEINPTNDPNVWVMNDDSGRYSQRPAEPGEPANPRGLTDTRTPDQLRNANGTLNQADLGGKTVTNEADLYGDQHYPAMKSTAQR